MQVAYAIRVAYDKCLYKKPNMRINASMWPHRFSPMVKSIYLNFKNSISNFHWRHSSYVRNFGLSYHVCYNHVPLSLCHLVFNVRSLCDTHMIDLTLN